MEHSYEDVTSYEDEDAFLDMSDEDQFEFSRYLSPRAPAKLPDQHDLVEKDPPKAQACASTAHDAKPSTPTHRRPGSEVSSSSYETGTTSSSPRPLLSLSPDRPRLKTKKTKKEKKEAPATRTLLSGDSPTLPTSIDLMSPAALDAENPLYPPANYPPVPRDLQPITSEPISRKYSAQNCRQQSRRVGHHQIHESLANSPDAPHLTASSPSVRRSIGKARSYDVLRAAAQVDGNPYGAFNMPGAETTSFDHSMQNFSMPLGSENARLKSLSSLAEAPPGTVSLQKVPIRPHRSRNEVQKWDISRPQPVAEPSSRTPHLLSNEGSSFEKMNSSGVGAFFLKHRHREPKSTEELQAKAQTTVSLTPRCELAWRPFDEPVDEPMCSSSWLLGNEDSRLQKKLREGYFTEKVERQGREQQQRVAAMKQAAKSATRHASDPVGRGRRTDQREPSIEVAGSNLIPPARVLPPLPPPGQPPPVLPLPVDMRAGYNGQASQCDNDARGASNSSSYRPRRLRGGLRTDTRRLLRKASAEAAEALTGGLRSKFKGFGKLHEQKEEEVDENGKVVPKSYFHWD